MVTPSFLVLCRGQAFIRRTIMENIALIGIDLGKNSFHI
ncbi:IS110 family transposase, partial [Escherichia coli]